MKRNNIFDKKLYIEGLRQTKVFGIITSAAMLIAALLPSFSHIYDHSGSLSTYNMYSLSPAIAASIYIVAPVITLYLFRFLNRRVQSDFYHSIPQTRTCLIISFAAAAATWTVFEIILSSAAVLLVSLFAGAAYLLNMASVLPFMLSCICGSLLVCAVCLLAVSLTGNLFANMLLTYVILFVPRILIFFVTRCITSFSFTISAQQTFGLLDACFNIPAGIPLSYIGWMLDVLPSDSITECFTLKASLYSFVLAAVYFALAVIAFNKRPSEAAHSFSPCRWVRHLAAGGIAMLLCLFPCYVFSCSIYADKYDYYTYEVNSFACVLFYGAAFIIYFAAELAVSRKLSGIIRSLPGFAVIAALNIIIIFAVPEITASQTDYIPESENVTSISIIAYEDSDNYYSLMTETVEITDPGIIELVLESLSYTKDHIEYINGSYDAQYYSDTIVIRENGKKLFRKIYFTPSDYRSFTELLSNVEEIRKIYTELPSYADINASFIEICGADSMYQSDSEADIFSDIYETAREEIRKIDFNALYEVLNIYKTTLELNGQTYNIDDIGYIYITAVFGTDICELAVPIIPVYMPETCEAFTAVMNNNHSGDIYVISEYLERCAAGDSTADEYYIISSEDGELEIDQYCSATVVPCTDEYYIDAALPEIAEKMLDIIENDDSTGDVYILLSYYINTWYTEDYMSVEESYDFCDYYVRATYEDLAELEALCAEADTLCLE